MTSEGRLVPRASASSLMASSFQAGGLIKRLLWLISLGVTVGIAPDQNPSSLILLVAATLKLTGWLKGNSLAQLGSITTHYQLT